MNPRGDREVPLAGQIRHQLRLSRRRWSWIPWLFPAGFVLSCIALVTIVPDYRERGSPLFTVVFLAASFLLFGWFVVAWWSLPGASRPGSFRTSRASSSRMADRAAARSWAGGACTRGSWRSTSSPARWA